MIPESIGFDKPQYDTLILLIDLVLKGALILVAARILTGLMVKSMAATRHLIWAAALVVILLLPALSVFLPSIDVPVMQKPFEETSAPAETALTANAADPFNEESQAALADALASAEAKLNAENTQGQNTNTAAGLVGQAVQQQNAETAQPLTTLSVQPILGNAGTTLVAIISQIHWTGWIMIVWGLGVLLIAGWTLTGLVGAWWITARSTTSDQPEWEELSEEIAERFMILREVRIRFSAQVTSPMTWGMWRPVVLLPIDADDWSPERRRYVMLHEMAHIKRWDTLTQFFAQIGVAVHWFNPLAWRGLYFMRIEQEKACDDQVLKHGMKPSSYASHLLEIARSIKLPWVSPLNTLSMARPSQLEGRVMEILKPEKKGYGIDRKKSIMIVVLVCAFLLPISALSPWEQQKNPVITTSFASGEALSTATRLADMQEARALQLEELRAREQVLFNQRQLRDARLAREALAGQANASPFAEWKNVAVADTSEKQRRARKQAVAALRKSLKDKDAEVRKHAIMTLSEMGDTGSVDMFIDLLKNDPSAEVREFAVMGLSEMDSREAKEALRVALDDKSDSVREHALMALAQHADEESMPVLIDYLQNDKDADIRKMAAIALGEIGDVEAVDALTEALEDKDAAVRQHAAMALSQLNYGDENENSFWDEVEELEDEGWEGEWENSKDEDFEWNEEAWENATEDFGEAAASLGISAAELGIAIGDLSLDLTADLLKELHMEIEAADLAEAERDLADGKRELELAREEMRAEFELNKHELKDEICAELKIALEEEGKVAVREAMKEIGCSTSSKKKKKD